MTDPSNKELDRMTAICEVFADSFSDADELEINQALADAGLNADRAVSDATRSIENTLNRVLKKKLVAAGQAARRQLSEVRPDLSNLSREQLVEKLRLITANEDNAGETLTMAARGGRDSMTVDELRSLVEDFYSINPINEDD